MITKEAIENYAEIQGGRCAEVFSMRGDILASEDKWKYARVFLEQSIKFHSEESKNLPLDKSRQIEYIINNYDIEALMLKWKQLVNKKSSDIGTVIFGWLFGGLAAKVVGSALDMDLEGIDDDEKAQVVNGLILICLWDESN